MKCRKLYFGFEINVTTKENDKKEKNVRENVKTQKSQTHSSQPIAVKTE
jgi:hypothetical protein